MSMGVYIENMEIPTEEYGPMTIKVYPNGHVAEYIGDIGRVWDAVPVPPHGRLGDLDKQDVQINALIERHLHGYTKSTWEFVCELRDILKRNRTIIEAEPSEEQREYEAAVEAAQYCEMYEPTYDPETGAM
jgi:hypothetical protein